MPTFAEAVRSQVDNKVILYRAVSRDGQDFYAYIRCNEKKYHKMKHNFATKSPCCDVGDYGEVIYVALGKEPDAAAESFLDEYLKNM